MQKDIISRATILVLGFVFCFALPAIQMRPAVATVTVVPKERNAAAAAKPLIIAELEALIEKYPGDGRARQAQSILEYYQQNEPGTRNLNEGCK